MSDIDVHAYHDLDHDAARAAADDLAADLARRFDITYGWNGDTIEFQRVGVDGTIDVDPKEMRIQARLGFLLAFLKPTIESEIRRYLSEHFGCTFSE